MTSFVIMKRRIIPQSFDDNTLLFAVVVSVCDIWSNPIGLVKLNGQNSRTYLFY